MTVRRDSGGTRRSRWLGVAVLWTVSGLVGAVVVPALAGGAVGSVGLVGRDVWTVEASDLGLSRPVDVVGVPGSGGFLVAGSIDGEPSVVRVGATWDQVGEAGPVVVDRAALEALRAGSGEAEPSVAVNPVDGLLYRLVAGDRLEVWDGSVEVGTVDLSGVGLVSPQAITFAPSTDITDDVANLHLFVADSGDERWTGGITEVVFMPLIRAVASTHESATLVQSFPTRPPGWSPSATDPSGIVWDPGPGEFLVVDSEVNETQIFDDVNLWKVDTSGAVIGTGATDGPNSAGSYSNEPTGVGLDAATDTMFITDDTGVRSLYVVTPGGDGVLGNTDDVVEAQIDVGSVAVDPEDPEYHVTEGVVYFLSGIDREIHRLDPVDSTYGNANDDLTSFDISHLGPTDFEGLTSAPNRGTLYVGARNADTIYEITTDGTLLRTINVDVGQAFISGLALGPSSTNPNELSLWFTDRAADEVNDGTLYEISVPGLDDSSSGNRAPVAVDDGVGTDVDVAVTVDVLANDSDPDLDALSVVNVSTPGNGAVVVNPDDTVTYTPDPGWSGTDSFTYEAFDGSLSSNPATVTVNVVDDGIVDQFAISEESVFGSVGTGSLASTFQSDDVAEELAEEHTGGPRSSRVSRLDHRWTFDIAQGDAITFVLEARRPGNSEADDFDFSYSIDGGANFTPLVTVTETSDTTHFVALPNTISGTVIVRVTDSDRSAGSGVTDSVFVDRLVIQTDNAQAPLPSVTIDASDPTADETGDPGAFTVSRDDTSVDLEVQYALTGDATLDSDYEVVLSANVTPVSVTIPAGQASVTIDIVPLDDTEEEGDESIVATILPDASYRVGAPSEAGIVLADDDVTGGDLVAVSQDTVRGDIVAGDLSSTYLDDGGYLQIREQAYAGGRRTRFEHRWTFEVGAGRTLTFFLQAHHDGTEDFVFAYSADGSSWTDMVQLTKTVDDGSYQQFVLPAGITGTVIVRARDLDSSRPEPVQESIFVDHLFIRAEP